MCALSIVAVAVLLVFVWDGERVEYNQYTHLIQAADTQSGDWLADSIDQHENRLLIAAFRASRSRF